ncbi:hypothetical protein [Nocardioides sp. URHA0020]|uniref:hypothetical protein n=1 Tax=Nocardioides sp. URHA0020 TaxID=1380392 RepID=UPI0006862F3B|nr:hypothetical protein [Nocardioides sp. URHA0020]
MTQTQAPPAAATATAAPATPPTPAASAASARRDRTEDVPRLLSRWQVVAVLACLLFAALTAGLQALSWSANRAAADNTEQLVRVQNIQSTLFRADALATTAFLTGGLEPPEQRAAYDEAIETVTRQITEAAEAQPADRAALADLSAAVTDYNSTIAQARANNRQGFPVGAEYLRTASTGLRDTSVEGSAIPLVQALVAANAERAEDELGAQHPLLVLLPGLVALGLLFWVNRNLARRFRRRINLGIAAAFLTVAALTLVAFVVAAIQAGNNADLRDGSYATSYRESTARTAGNDAKANESLRLISRGSGQVYEDRWTAASDVVRANASDVTEAMWDDYAGVHDKIVELDDGGRYDAAVELATTQEDAGSTAKLNAFDARSQKVVSESGAATTDALRSGNTGILVLGIVTLLLGIAAAGMSVWGIGLRRREYA